MWVACPYLLVILKSLCINSSCRRWTFVLLSQKAPRSDVTCRVTASGTCLHQAFITVLIIACILLVNIFGVCGAEERWSDSFGQTWMRLLQYASSTNAFSVSSARINVSELSWDNWTTIWDNFLSISWVFMVHMNIWVWLHLGHLGFSAVLGRLDWFINYTFLIRFVTLWIVFICWRRPVACLIYIITSSTPVR